MKYNVHISLIRMREGDLVCLKILLHIRDEGLVEISGFELDTS